MKKKHTIGSYLIKQKLTLFSLIMITPSGFFLKLYSGPARNWVNNSFAGVLYEIFWCLLLFFFWARKEYITKIALTVFIGTCLLEILQLWHPWFLEKIRATFIGRTIIGTTFYWWDVPYYLLGCLIGWFWMRKISKKMCT